MENILSEFNIEQNKISERAFFKLINNAKANDLKKQFVSIKNQLFEIFTMYKENEEFKEYHLILENAHAKKQFEFKLNMDNFPNINIESLSKLDEIGLTFYKDELKILGIPTIAGNFEIEISFSNINDSNSTIDKKYVTFIVNADPKDLWKSIPSDSAALYYKNDENSFSGDFIDKKIVVASKRGRSHAHEGTFRDDDFCVKKLFNDWNIIAVADGAGSAKFARKGSSLSVEYICNYFNSVELLNYFDENVILFNNSKQSTEDNNIEDLSVIKLEAKKNIIQTLYKGVRELHEELKRFSVDEGIAIKDLNTTLIFTLVKKFDFGYVVLSFGVGDCPINLLSVDNTSVQLLNILDVGEFGGGTRFITMNEIFSNPNMGSRFGINIYEDFSKLILMTDGIYDPKFVTENKLEDIETWQEFLKDLDGNNEENLKVEFDNDIEIEKQLLNWMDFWSKGNHDDRTLAIIY